MKKFNIEIFKGVPFIRENDDVILIDTGATNTISSQNEYEFLGESYNVLTNYMGIDMQQLRNMLGKDITSVLGADILSKYVIMFDYQKNSVEFHDTPINIDEKNIPMELFMNVPVIELFIDNERLRMFIDTGANLSYLTEEYLTGYESIGEFDDFLPGFGNFSTSVYEIITKMNNSIFNVRYGVLPELLQMTLMMANVQGVIGNELFQNFKILIDYPNRSITYKKHDT